MLRLTLFNSSLTATCVFVCLFDLILYVPVNNLLVKSGRVFLGWTSTKLGLMCLAQGHNAVTPVRLEPAAIWSRVKHSTTDHRATALPYCNMQWIITNYCYDHIVCSVQCSPFITLLVDITQPCYGSQIYLIMMILQRYYIRKMTMKFLHKIVPL